MWILFLILAIIALFLILRILKTPKLGNMILISGGIKTGKSTLSVHLTLNKLLRKQRRKYYIKTFLLKIAKKLNIKKFKDVAFPEKPLLYSNIPIRTEYVPVTKKLLLRQERFVYGSVVYMCEASLVADSMTYKDDEINENLLLLNKLFAHETKGGYIVYDTQSISDNHYAVKRCLSSYLYVHHTVKIPFFLLMWVRELKYSDDGSSINTFNEDVESKLKLIIVPKRVWKFFDCYAYSALTDHLPVNCKTRIPVSLKAEDIVSFKQYMALEKMKREKLKKEAQKNDEISTKA